MDNSVKHGKREYKSMSLEVAVRNPDRYGDFLRVFSKFEGKKLNDATILEIYATLCHEGVITAEHIDFSSMSLPDIEEYIRRKNKHNNEWGYPTGYQAAFTRYLKTLSEFGFIYAQYEQPLELSMVAKAAIDKEISLSDAFALQSMRFWRKSPYRRVLNDFNFFDFIYKLIEKRQEKGHPMSVAQFDVALFSRDGNVSEMDAILDRNRIGDSEEKAYILVNNIYGSSSPIPQKIPKKDTVFRDYGNSVLRVMLLTGFVRLDVPSGYKLLKIGSDRADLLHKLQNEHFSISEDAKESEKKYFQELGSFSDHLRQIILASGNAKSNVVSNLQLKDLLKQYGITRDDLISDLDLISQHSGNVQESALKIKSFPMMQMPLRFEFYLSLLLCEQYGTDFEIKPNYVAGSDGVPYSHAPGNMGDIELFNKDNYWLVEVTLIRNKNQQINTETNDLFRHINAGYSGKNPYLSLVAPYIHEDTQKQFNVCLLEDSLNGLEKLKAMPQDTKDFIDGTLKKNNLETISDYSEVVFQKARDRFGSLNG